jgi:hypothetical protein
MNAFHWRTFVQPWVAKPRLSEIRGVETAEWDMVPGGSIKPKIISPQAAHYHRKKLGLVGTRAKPVRGWREKI